MGSRSFLFANDGQDAYQVATPPRFDLAAEPAAAMAYLDAHGYCVIGAAAPPPALGRLQTLLWDELESLGRGLDRRDPGTWQNFPDMPFAQSTVGLFVGDGLGQSQLMWSARALPVVRRAFGLSFWHHFRNLNKNTQNLPCFLHISYISPEMRLN